MFRGSKEAVSARRNLVFFEKDKIKLTIMFFLVSFLPSSERNGVRPYKHS